MAAIQRTAGAFATLAHTTVITAIDAFFGESGRRSAGSAYIAGVAKDVVPVSQFVATVRRARYAPLSFSALESDCCDISREGARLGVREGVLEVARQCVREGVRKGAPEGAPKSAPEGAQGFPEAAG